MSTLRFLLLVLAAGLLASAPSYHDVRGAAPTTYRPCLLGWIPYWDQQRAVRSFVDHVDLFCYVSVFWYFIDESGEVRAYRDAKEDERIIEFAHQNEVKVLALIANLPDEELPTWQKITSSFLGIDNEEEGSSEDWDRNRVARVISSPSERRKHISDLVELTLALNYDGINIDYEELAREDRENFSAFIRELATALHEKNKILAVATHPKTTEFDPAESNGSQAQDWGAISASADQMHFLTYGQHWAGSDPGPIAAPRWMKPILDYAVLEQKVPPGKIFLGVPLYAEAWEKTDSECRTVACYVGNGLDLTYTDVEQLMLETESEPSWHTKSSSPYLLSQIDDVKQIVWFENARSIQPKLKLAEAYGICNFALWRLGGEDPEIWSVLHDMLRRLQQNPEACRYPE